MTNYYTDDTAVAHELRSTDLFASTTIPSLEDVSEWIGQYSEYVDGVASKTFTSSDYTEYFNYDGATELYLRHNPINTIASVSQNTAVEGSTPVWVDKVEGIHFSYDPDKSYIKIFTGKWTGLKAGFRNLRVVYNAGFLEVPPRIKLLTTKLVAARVINTLLNNNISERNDGGSISVGDIRIVEPGAYGVSSYKNLQQDIIDLEKEIIGGYRVYRYG